MTSKLHAVPTSVTVDLHKIFTICKRYAYLYSTFHYLPSLKSKLQNTSPELPHIKINSQKILPQHKVIFSPHLFYHPQFQDPEIYVAYAPQLGVLAKLLTTLVAK